jgi:hypothetical protein
MGAPSLPGFNLEPTFFGFKPEDRPILHENLFNLIWQGEGRWDWDTIYHMPIHIRRYWVKRVNAIIKDREDARAEQLKAMKSQQNKKSQVAQPPKVRR